MSGIYIHGMEMPKTGNWKTIRIYYDGTCAESNWQGDCKYMCGCEAVPVPDHGRLIDADALAKDGWHLNRYYSDSNGCWIENMTLENAPTIIQSDKDGAE